MEKKIEARGSFPMSTSASVGKNDRRLAPAGSSRLVRKENKIRVVIFLFLFYNQPRPEGESVIFPTGWQGRWKSFPSCHDFTFVFLSSRWLAGIRDPDQREGRMKTKDRVTKEKNIGCWRTWVFFWMSFSFSFKRKERKNRSSKRKRFHVPGQPRRCSFSYRPDYESLY